jgi:hypothetical protein
MLFENAGLNYRLAGESLFVWNGAGALGFLHYAAGDLPFGISVSLPYG